MYFQAKEKKEVIFLCGGYPEDKLDIFPREKTGLPSSCELGCTVCAGPNRSLDLHASVRERMMMISQIPHSQASVDNFFFCSNSSALLQITQHILAIELRLLTNFFWQKILAHFSTLITSIKYRLIIKLITWMD